jgi:hypothetical protein
VATTLEDIFLLARRSSFVERIQAAIAKAAVAVAAEAPQEGERPRLRRALSAKVLENSEEYAPRFALAVATNAVITQGSSDSDIEFTVNSMWDAIAGAEPPSP